MKVRVLLTGASGFIGKYLSSSLNVSKIPLLEVTRSTTNGYFCDIKDSKQVDLMLSQFCPTHLIHLAWCGGGGYAMDPLNYESLNSSMYLVDRFYKSGGHRFVGIGTCFEYAIGHKICSEYKTPTVPATFYGQCKLSLSEYVKASACFYGKSYSWCRLFYVTGCGDAMHKFIPSVCNSFLHNKEFTVNNPSTRLDYIDVRDVANAIKSVTLSDYEGIVNVGSGKGFKLGVIARLLQSKINGGKIYFLENETAPIELVADISVLQNAIHFKPQYNINKTLSAYVAGLGF